MANQQPRPPWFRFPFMFRTASPAPAAPVTQPSAPRAPSSPQPQPALVRPAPPPVASPPAAPIIRPPAPRTAPPPQLQPTLVRPAPPPVASPPPPAVTPAARPQTATPTPRSPVAPTSAPPRSPVPPPPAPVASPPPAVAPAATPAPLPPSISRSPVASSTASPPAVSPTKYPIVKTSVSQPPSPSPEESQRTSTNIPFLSSIPASPKTKDQVPSPSKPTPVVQKSMLHSPTPTARKASATGSPPEVAKERTPVQSTPIKLVSRPPSRLTPTLPQTKTATDHEPNITVISNGKREPTKDKGLHKKLSESEQYQTRVITLAGQNKGAVMELSASGPQSLDKNGKIKTWRNGEKSSSVEGKSVEDKTCDEMVMESPQMTAFLNSNVQGINNSIFHNCSSTHNDPGIHLSFSRKKDQRD